MTTVEQAKKLPLPSVVETLTGMLEDMVVSEEPALRAYGGRQCGHLKFHYIFQGSTVTAEKYLTYASAYPSILTRAITLPEKQAEHRLATFRPAD